MRRNFRNKCAAFMACASVLGGKTSAMNANKNQVKSSQTLGAVGGAPTAVSSIPYSNRQLSNKNGWSTSKKVIAVAGGSILLLAMGLITYGAKCYSDKKLLESAVTFLNGNPVIIESSEKLADEAKKTFNVAVKLFRNALTLLKDGKENEIKKLDFEVGIWGNTITIKHLSKDNNNKYIKHVISRNDDNSWTVKKYCYNNGVESKLLEVKLGDKSNENLKSSKKDDDKSGYDYVTEVQNRLSGKDILLSMFNVSIEKIKNYKFNEKDIDQLSEFLEVVKGEKKLFAQNLNGMKMDPFIVSPSSVSVKIGNFFYSIDFKIQGFSIQKTEVQSEKQVYCVKIC